MQHDCFFLIQSIISFICGVDFVVAVVVVGGLIKIHEVSADDRNYGPVFMEKSCPGQESHPPSRVNFSERYMRKTLTECPSYN